MSGDISIEAAGRDLKGLLERLHLGETVTVVGSDGAALAVLISLNPAPSQSEPACSWDARWDTLSQRISKAWKSKKSAVELLTEMRR